VEFDPIMMQSMRNNMKIVMIFVAIAFIGLMVFEWGMDITGQAGGTSELGRVNGEPVQYAAYTALYQQLYDQARQQAGGTLTAEQVKQIEDQAFNQVVNELLVQQELKRRGISVSNAEIRQAAMWNPHPDLMRNELFQTNGQFDIQKWQQFLSSPQANEQLLLQLEQYYRETLPRQKLMRQVTAGSWLSDAQLWQVWKDRNETATVNYVQLDLARLVPGEEAVSEGEISAYYKAHKDRFRRPATGRFTVAILSKAPTGADTAAAIQKADSLRREIVAGGDFAEIARRESSDPGSKEQGGELGTFGRGQMAPAFEQVAFSLPVGTVSEPVLTPFGIHLIEVEEHNGDQVRARHILIPIQPSDEAMDRLFTRADSLEALSASVGLQRAAQATKATVRNGVILSESQSFLPGVGSALEVVDWAKSDAGQVADSTLSPLYETPEAFYIANREAFQEAGTIPLKEATPEIRRELTIEKKRAKARALGQQMVAEVRKGKTLEQVAQERGLTVESAGPFTRISPNPAFGQATAAVGVSFGVPVGKVSDVTETPAGLFIIQPTAHVEAKRADFDAQKEQFRMMALYQIQQQEASRFIDALRSEAKIVDRRAQVLKQST
jgi:peptidyl-prolyl cis-trans isomerase D